MNTNSLSAKNTPHLTPGKLVGRMFDRNTFQGIEVALVVTARGHAAWTSTSPGIPPTSILSMSHHPACRSADHNGLEFLSIVHVYGGPVSSALVEELAYYGIKYILAYGLAGGLGTKGLKMGDFYLVEKALEAIFQRALKGKASPEDATRFTGHMLMENARMSVEDGLVMQLHTGSYRSHNSWVFERFGRDMGADIPVQTEYTRNLRPLLNKYGNDSRLTLILFTLDETTYSRELAPLARHYPAVKLGPPWWFHDSLEGMTRYRQQIVETTGLYNTVGFNDDTRAFPSIPARHDLWRRVDANWMAGLVVRGIVDIEDAEEMIYDSVYRLA